MSGARTRGPTQEDFDKALVKSVFLRSNTPIPSSSPVEALFSSGGQQLFRPQRRRMTAKHFEKLLVIKGAPRAHEMLYCITLLATG